jgi:seryl-tRNA synthetase
MSELQDMLCVQARLHKKQGANALGDLFENASKEITRLQERNAELEKENKRESMELRSRLGSALGRNSEYNSAIENMQQQLAKANERVKELELVIVAITHADETGYVDDVGFVKGWSDVCDETKALLNKFAIENQIKGAKFYGDKLNELGFDSVGEFTDKVCEQLRKEQE